MKYYMAYGSNLNKQQMRLRCPDAVPVTTAAVQDYQLVFRRGVLTLEPSQGTSVPVAIWSISERDEKHLDVYEGFPAFYHKETWPIMASIDGKDRESVSCMVYIMNDGYPIQAPSDNYFYTVYGGYKDFGLYTGPLVQAYEQAKWGDDE